MKDYISYPINYDEGIARMVNNGCGTSGWKGKLVPDTIYGISISEPCKVHDYEYHRGTIADEKEMADIRFYKNLKLTIKHESKWWNKALNPLRYIRAKAYYTAVANFGDGAFFDGKTGVS